MPQKHAFHAACYDVSIRAYASVTHAAMRANDHAGHSQGRKFRMDTLHECVRVCLLQDGPIQYSLSHTRELGETKDSGVRDVRKIHPHDSRHEMMRTYCMDVVPSKDDHVVMFL